MAENKNNITVLELQAICRKSDNGLKCKLISRILDSINEDTVPTNVSRISVFRTFMKKLVPNQLQNSLSNVSTNESSVSNIGTQLIPGVFGGIYAISQIFFGLKAS